MEHKINFRPRRYKSITLNNKYWDRMTRIQEAEKIIGSYITGAQFSRLERLFGPDQYQVELETDGD